MPLFRQEGSKVRDSLTINNKEMIKYKVVSIENPATRQKVYCAQIKTAPPN